MGGATFAHAHTYARFSERWRDCAKSIVLPSMWSCLLHVSTFKSSESLLVSAMSSGVGCRRHSISSWLRLSRLRRVNFYLPVFLLAFVVSGTNATSCPFPCNPASQCVSLDPSSCQHGVVKDVCECCDVCGHGPDDFCGPYGKCGEGLVCVQGYEEGLSEEDLRDYPSFCKLAPASSKLLYAPIIVYR